MTDKQIIIDRIDVSGCDCFITQMDFPNNLEGGYYNQNNLCECGIQGVESYPFFCKDNPNCYYKQLKAKEQECEELKKYIKHLHNLCGNETDKQYKLKQTLTKIKEICNNNDELKGDFNLVDCDKYKLGKHNLANRILQKISECEGNDEKH